MEITTKILNSAGQRITAYINAAKPAEILATVNGTALNYYAPSFNYKERVRQKIWQKATRKFGVAESYLYPDRSVVVDGDGEAVVNSNVDHELALN